jgi:hypothetical protein
MLVCLCVMGASSCGAACRRGARDPARDAAGPGVPRGQEDRAIPDPSHHRHLRREQLDRCSALASAPYRPWSGQLPALVQTRGPTEPRAQSQQCRDEEHCTSWYHPPSERSWIETTHCYSTCANLLAKRALHRIQPVMQPAEVIQRFRWTAAATPHGTFPTGIRFKTRRVAISTTVTSFDGPFAV